MKACFPRSTEVSMSGIRFLVLWVIMLGVASSQGAVELLSNRNSLSGLPASGNGDSVAPWISADSRYVIFSSSASDLITNDNNQLTLDVFMKDRSTGIIHLVSVNTNGTGGGDGGSKFGMASADGRYVVFESSATDLTVGDTSIFRDIFVRDVLSNTTALVSISLYGFSGNGFSTEPVISGDGRYVAFISTATNLVAGDNNRIPDVFVRDLILQTTVRASAEATGNLSATMSSPVIVSNGQFVAFSSSATGSGMPGTPGEIYVRDMIGNSTVFASTNAASLASNYLAAVNVRSYHPAISDDGRFVVFKTTLTNGTGKGLVLQYDSSDGSTTVIGTNSFPAGVFGDDLYGPEMTSDGSFVVWASREGGTNSAFSNVYRWERQSGSNVLVSADLLGNAATNATSHTASVSSDGRFVVFVSNGTNLIAGSVTNGFHIYLRDLVTDTTQLVDANTNGIGAANQRGTIPSLSADGKFIAFSSLDETLIDSDSNAAADIFVRNTTNSTTELVSRRDPGISVQSGNGFVNPSQFALSADGGRAAFASYAGDLVPGDFNKAQDVFVHDLAIGTNILVSVGTNGLAGSGGFSGSPLISGDGRYVAFLSAATNLVSKDSNGAADVFLRDLQSGNTALVSVNSATNSLGTGDSLAFAMSLDGRYLAFLTRTNFSAPSATYFWRDVQSGVTLRIANISTALLAPSMSSNGRYVAFLDSQSRLLIWDSQTLTNVYTNSSTISSFALSPDGSRIAYRSTQLFITEWAGNSNLFNVAGVSRIPPTGQWSGDGTRFVFSTFINLGGDPDLVSDVYLRDLQSGTTTLISADQIGTPAGITASDAPIISGDGRILLFRRMATNVVSGLSNAPVIIMHDRLTSSNHVVAVRSRQGWSSWMSRPAVSSDGKEVVFQSWDGDLVPGDRNRFNDLFGSSFASLIDDTDGDGIPNDWLVQYFGHPLGQAGDSSRAQDDADGDGMTNLQEYQNGTNPLDSSSVFYVFISLTSSNSVMLSWPAVSNRNYRVESRTELGTGNWSSVSGDFLVPGNLGEFTIPVTETNYFYRVVKVD